MATSAVAVLDRRIRQAAAEIGRAAPAAVSLDRGLLSLSFDDVPAAACRAGAAVLEAHGVRATFFVCMGLMGRAFEGAPQFEAGDLERLHAAGHEIGCHTHGHESALSTPPAAFAEALDRNAAALTATLGQPPTAFAYPYGHVSAAAKRLAAERFAFARSVAKGLNRGPVDRARLAAHGFERRRGLDVDRLLKRAAEERAWLILYSHDVAEDPTPYGCRPRDLARLIEAAGRAGLDVAPVTAAGRRACAVVGAAP